MAFSPAELFAEKGTVEIFCEIGEGGGRFNEILENVSISHQTLTTRLRQAQEANLLTTESVNRGNGTVHIYKYTYAGSQIYQELDERGVVDNYEVFRVARQQFEEDEASFIEWMKQNEDDVIDWSRWETASGDVYGKPDDKDSPDPADPSDLSDRE